MKNQEVVVRGADELNELIKNFKASQKRSIWISTFRRASKPLVKRMKANVKSKHRNSGNLYKAHGNSPSRSKMSLKVGSRYSGKNKGYQAHLLNSGTKDRSYVTKSGKRHKTGRVKASKYFDTAVDSQLRVVEKNVANEFKISIEKLIDRAEKKARKNNK